MDKLDTSFIPQQPLIKVEGSLRFREGINLPLMLGLIAVFISAAVYGGMYFYKGSVERRITLLEKELESKEEVLQISEIDRYKDIDTRLTLATQLLRGHVAFSTILSLLEQITAQNIGWTSLSYGKDEHGLVRVSLNGQAPSYSAVYVQKEAWRGMGSLLADAKVGMPLLSPEDGTVSFSATLIVDPSYIKYARTIKTQDESTESTDSSGESIPATVTSQTP